MQYIDDFYHKNENYEALRILNCLISYRYFQIHIMLMSINIAYTQKDATTSLGNISTKIFFLILQEYSVQITFRQKWNDDRLSYANRLAIGDMSSKYIDTQSLTSTKSKV